MADNGFNGTTAVWSTLGATSSTGGALIGSGIRGIRYTDGGAEIQLSGSTDAEHSFHTGISDKEVTIDFVGTSTALSSNSFGRLDISWNDGTSAPALTAALCTAVNYGGNMDGELSGSATFAPLDT